MSDSVTPTRRGREQVTVLMRVTETKARGTTLAVFLSMPSLDALTFEESVGRSRAIFLLTRGQWS